MKKAFIILTVIVLSLLITFFVFDIMSWYSFSTFPTKIVLLRMIIFFTIVVIILMGVILLIRKYRK